MNMNTEPRMALLDSAPPLAQGRIADSSIPRNVTTVMPSLVAQANTQALIQSAVQEQPVLTPGDLSRPLPSIVTTEPVQVGPVCDPMTAWINDNPMLALGVLGVLAYFTFGHKGRG